MIHKKPHTDPKIIQHLRHAIHQEWHANLSLLKFQWPFVLLFVVGLATLIYLARPFPPTHLKLATGQPNSSLEALGKKYVDHFKQNGVQLELVRTAGAHENIDMLKQGKVDAAFSVGGIELGEGAEDIVSLGSVEYQPFWLFYRGQEYDGSNPTQFFSGKKLSINIPGSGTRRHWFS